MTGAVWRPKRQRPWAFGPRLDWPDVTMQSGRMEIPAGKFKATCLKLMDRVAATGEPIVITKRGKPLARLVPVRDDQSNPSSGCGSGKGTVVVVVSDEELMAPFPVKWNALG